jgi:hypothetical protein
MDSVQRSLSRPGLKDVGVVGERTGNSCENRGAWGFSGQTTELAEDFYGLGSVVQVCSEGLLSPMLNFIERAILRAGECGIDHRLHAGHFPESLLRNRTDAVDSSSYHQSQERWPRFAQRTSVSLALV